MTLIVEETMVLLEILHIAYGNQTMIFKKINPEKWTIQFNLRMRNASFHVWLPNGQRANKETEVGDTMKVVMFEDK